MQWKFLKMETLPIGKSRKMVKEWVVNGFSCFGEKYHLRCKQEQTWRKQTLPECTLPLTGVKCIKKPNRIRRLRS